MELYQNNKFLLYAYYIKDKFFNFFSVIIFISSVKYLIMVALSQDYDISLEDSYFKVP